MSPLNRRSFLGRGAASAATATAVAGLGPLAAGSVARADTDARKPNVLVVMVDEMRAHQWFPAQQRLDALLPNLARIRRQATEFTSHYTAANMCTPARGALLTGLYPHQTGCMLTNQSTLSPGFPTWGSMMREHGYQTAWYGKWHLGHTSDTTPRGLEPYGFDGGTYPSPNGAPSQGLHSDPGIADQFISWFDHRSADAPWCTTVSLVNPHDVQWWPRWTRLLELQNNIPQVFTHAAPNFETPQELERNKPRLQSALRQVSEIAFGFPGYQGSTGDRQFAGLLNLYLWLQQKVDAQIGRVLDALHSNPAVAANTIVIFTADHGDYAGSHGLHGKGGAAYDEAIRVPLYVHDPRGQYSSSIATTRDQLTSSVDLAPFLLTIASGGTAWRREPRYGHLAGRADLAAICGNPAAAGRDWIAHVTDERTIEEGALAFQGDAPSHVIAVRTPTAKLGVYSHWYPRSTTIDRHRHQEYELYDYTTEPGRREIDNLAHAGAPKTPLVDLINRTVIPTETNAPLPEHLHDAQTRGLADYYAQLGTLVHTG